MVKKRRRHSAAYKFRIALEALEGSKTISRLSCEYLIHPNMIRAWKRQLLEDRPSVFASNGERKQRQQEAQEAELNDQIRRLKMELEWLMGIQAVYPRRSCSFPDKYVSVQGNS